MNTYIMNWSSEQFYHGRLVADNTVKDQTIDSLFELKHFKAPLMLIDTAGNKMGENFDKDG